MIPHSPVTRPGWPRRRARKWLLWLGAFLLLGLFSYSRWVEPGWIEVTHHHVVAPLAPPVKIAHVTDLHVNSFGRRERRVIEILGRERPDVILITGDVLGEAADWRLAAQVLSRLKAPLGTYFVRGNWESALSEQQEAEMYAASGTVLLRDAAREIRPGLWLIGYDDMITREPHAGAAQESIPRGAYVIALFHAPLMYEYVADKCNLALCGHTHGGQVVIPFVGPMWMPAAAGNFVSGWYAQKSSRLYVNRGVGMSRLHFRFNARPEVAFITLSP